MKLPINMFPQEIVQHYNLKDLVAAYKYVYMEIRKGMPGIKQAGRQSSNCMTKNLAEIDMHRYHTHLSSGSTTRQTSCFLSSSTTLESSTHKSKTPTTC